MKARILWAASASLLICVINAQAVSAQSDVELIQAPPSLTSWSNRVMTTLDKGIRVRDDMTHRGARTGIVAVKFNCSESGAPAGVELLKSSGNHEYDRATVMAVRRIASLHPLPKGLGHDQKYVIRMLFAESESSAKNMIAQMRREADRNNAWYLKNEPTTAALELVPVG